MGQILQKFKYIKCLLKCITCFDFSKLNFKHDLRIQVSKDGYVMHKRNAIEDFRKAHVGFSICNLPLFSCDLQPLFSTHYDDMLSFETKAYCFSDYVLVVVVEYPLALWARLKTLTMKQLEGINKAWNAMYEEQ